MVGTLEPPRLENTHFLLGLFPSNLHLSSVSFLLVTGSPTLFGLFWSFLASPFSVPFAFKVPISVRLSASLNFLFVYLLHSAVTFSITPADLWSFSRAVSSLLSFRLPIVTLVLSVLRFLFARLMFALFCHDIVPSFCPYPLSSAISLPTILVFFCDFPLVCLMMLPWSRLTRIGSSNGRKLRTFLYFSWWFIIVFTPPWFRSVELCGMIRLDKN